MVPNSGTKARASAIKLLNAPTPVTVNVDERGMPSSVSVRDKVNEIVAIEDMWKINDEWWRGPDKEIERVYFHTRLFDGRSVTLFNDLVTDGWFKQ